MKVHADIAEDYRSRSHLPNDDNLPSHVDDEACGKGRHVTLSALSKFRATFPALSGDNKHHLEERLVQEVPPRYEEGTHGLYNLHCIG